MKKIGDLLGKVRNFREGADEVDEKIIESIFFDVLKKESPNIMRADIQSTRFKDGRLFVKTNHPTIASEIWRKREKIKNMLNKRLEREAVKIVRVK